MTDLERAEWEMIARARQGLSPSPDDQARVQAATLRAIASGAAAISSVAEQAGSAEAAGDRGLDQQDLLQKAAAARQLPSWLSKLLSGVLIAAPAFGAGYFVGRQGDRDQAPSPQTFADPARASAAPPVSDVGLSKPPAPSNTEPAPPSDAANPSKASPPKAQRISLEEELLLLRRAESALRTGDPSRALSLLEELDRKAPGGTLAEERRAAFVTARCQMTQDDATTALAKNFERRHPKSVYLKRVQQACRITAEAGGSGANQGPE